MKQAKENRLAVDQTAIKISSGDDSSVHGTAGRFTGAALHVVGAYVAVVNTDLGTHRRRVFLTLSSAQRAVDRAIEAGHHADVVLCRLVPVRSGDAQ